MGNRCSDTAPRPARLPSGSIPPKGDYYKTFHEQSNAPLPDNSLGIAAYAGRLMGTLLELKKLPQFTRVASITFTLHPGKHELWLEKGSYNPVLYDDITIPLLHGEKLQQIFQERYGGFRITTGTFSGGTGWLEVRWGDRRFY